MLSHAHTCILCHPTYIVTHLCTIIYTYSHILLCYPTHIHISGTYTRTQAYAIPYKCTHRLPHSHLHAVPHTHTLTPSHNTPIYSHYYTLQNHSIHIYSYTLVPYPMHTYPLGRLSHPHTSILFSIHMPSPIILARTYTSSHVCVLTLCHTHARSHTRSHFHDPCGHVYVSHVLTVSSGHLIRSSISHPWSP